MKAKRTLFLAILVLTSLHLAGPVRAEIQEGGAVEHSSITTGDASSQTTVINQVNTTKIDLCDCTPTPPPPTSTPPPSNGGGGTGGTSSVAGAAAEPAKTVLGLSNTSSNENTAFIMLALSLLLVSTGLRLIFKKA